MALPLATQSRIALGVVLTSLRLANMPVRPQPQPRVILFLIFWSGFSKSYVHVSNAIWAKSPISCSRIIINKSLRRVEIQTTHLSSTNLQGGQNSKVTQDSRKNKTHCTELTFVGAPVSREIRHSYVFYYIINIYSFILSINLNR